MKTLPGENDNVTASLCFLFGGVVEERCGRSKKTAFPGK